MLAASWRAVAVRGLLFPFAVAFLVIGAEPPKPETRREALMKQFTAGNYKDAYEGLRKLALDPQDDRSKVGEDLTTAVTCLQYLGRSDEIDAFREAVIKVHEKNWRLLDTAAQNYANSEHYGYIVAGKFYRGNHRGGGKYVTTMQRDRTRALQLIQEAMGQTAGEKDRIALSEFYLGYANMILNGGGYYEPWRLQYLTDLSQLPDYEEGYVYYGRRGRWNGGGSGDRGAPVDEKGDPI